MGKSQINNLSVNPINNYAIRTENHDDISHIIVPVVMMVEGVHSGSRGPILYTQEELSATASAWNGFPVVVNHPTNNAGEYIKAEDAPEEEVVGTIQNAHMDGNKLKADLRINPNTLSNISAESLEAINNQSPLDVSIGVLSEDDEVSGEFNNETYDAIAHNLRPDHLALLPGARGACSFDDGCGIRNQKIEVNKSQTKTSKTKNVKVERNKLTVKQMHAKLVNAGFVISEMGEQDFTLNEMGFREISNGIQSALDAFDGENKYHYLEEVFPDGSFIYVVRNNSDSTSTFYKRGYQVNDGTVSLTDNAVKVIREVSYPLAPVANVEVNKLIRTKKSNKIMNKKKVAPCKVDALISNEASNFTEDDREFLSDLDDATFNKVAPEPAKKVVVNQKVEAPAAEAPTKEVTANAVKAFFAEQKTPEAFIELMPKGLGDQMKSGLKLHNDRRNTLIESIVANSKFTKETLNGWENDDLETMYSSVVPEEKTDFSLMGEVGELTENENSGIAMKSMLRLDVEPENKTA